MNNSNNISQEASAMYAEEKRTAKQLDRALVNKSETDKLWEDAGRLGEPGTEESAAYLAGYDIDPVSAAMSAQAGAHQILSAAKESREQHNEASRVFYEQNASGLYAMALGEASLAGVDINQPEARE
jgi:hypothetical protein